MTEQDEHTEQSNAWQALALVPDESLYILNVPCFAGDYLYIHLFIVTKVPGDQWSQCRIATLFYLPSKLQWYLISRITMSFGYSISDGIKLIEIINDLRKRFVAAAKQSREIQQE